MLTRYLANSLLLLTFTWSAAAQQHPRDKEIHDPDTRAWWRTTEALSNDSMEGRDTGSAAYQRAAEYVAKRFEAAGLKPAGEGDSYFQTVRMYERTADAKTANFTIVRDNGEKVPLEFLQEITTTPVYLMMTGLPAMSKREADGSQHRVEARLTFRGYCGKDAMSDVWSKIVVCLGTQRRGLPGAAERQQNASGAAGIITVDDPYFTIEPPRWPYAYARSVTLEPPGTVRIISASPYRMMTPLRISAEAFTRILAGTGHDAAAILQAGGAKKPIASFDIPAHLEDGSGYSVVERDIASPNVFAVLPGTDAKLKGEYVVVAAHLDGYGFGTSVNGDNLYNGTLDDAAYVALLIQMADDIKAGRLPRPKRSILFCAFTGEEKGLLGSNWFVAHPTVPIAQMAADINLDQLRPLFPLKILTAEAVNDTTLGQTARDVGKPMGIEIREDMEPERGLLRRADQYPFLRAGVPAISFIFGYDAGTDAEKRYREWYQVRYHRPQDDLTQPMDFDAATKFNAFFYNLVDRVADAQERPKVIHPIGQ